MGNTDLLAAAFFLSFAANLVHWHLRGKRFLFHPASGWIRVVLMIWIITLLLSAVLSAIQVVDRSLVVNIGVACAVALQLYSIWQRQARQLPTHESLQG